MTAVSKGRLKIMLIERIVILIVVVFLYYNYEKIDL